MILLQVCKMISRQVAPKLLVSRPVLLKNAKSVSIFSKSKPPPTVYADVSVITPEKKEIISDPVPERGPLPMITSRHLDFLPIGRIPRQAWVENLDAMKEDKLGLVDLHPDVFARLPRMDVLHTNIVWQTRYRKVNWAWAPSRAELPGGGRKPWPQKGTGRARHGSVRSPLFLRGGKAHGPRGPKTYYFMLDLDQRVSGLCAALSAKLAQDDLKIVPSLDIPSTDPKFLLDLVDERKWGLSVLFVDDADIVPKNIALATDTIKHMNIMPVYGLNVHSMLRHETLVLTLAAVNKIEEKLIYHLNMVDAREARKPKKF